MIRHEFAQALVARFGSPLYVYDLDEVERRAVQLEAALPGDASLYFSLKANPLPAIGAVLSSHGYRAEISSTGELAAALEAGFEPGEMLYTGPGKTAGEIAEALVAGVVFFSSESWDDLTTLATVTERLGRSAEILLRLDPPRSPRAALAMSGRSRQFGFDPEDLLRNGERLGRSPKSVEFAGFHVYHGTQIESRTELIQTIQCSAELVRKVATRLKIPCRILDLGGGFPWPFATADEGPDLSGLADELGDLGTRDRTTEGRQLWFESGRYLSASCGTLISSVMAVRSGAEGRKQVILDAGINVLGGMSGLGRLLAPRLSLQCAGTGSTAGKETVDLFGPLCTPLDRLATGLEVTRPLSPGDVVAIPNVGAYGLTASLVAFLSRPRPLEITCRGERSLGIYRLRGGHRTLEPKSVETTREVR